jgi:hypothetical protein
MTRAIKKYENLCSPCYYFSHPEKTPLIRYLNKELRLREDMREFLCPYNPIYNEIIPNTCQIRNRPDIFISRNRYIIIIENDEKQHKRYDPLCEESRINNLYLIFCMPIIFIRFNPDSYTRSDGKKIPSCFHDDPNSFGGYKVHELEWTRRLNILKDTILSCIDIVPTKEYTEMFLFFDSYSK